MPTDYDGIAARYQTAKHHAWRTYVEAYTFLGMLGDLSGQAVVDLACGEGHYTRMLPSLGAARVVGVDLSGGMIALARAQEAEHPLGIEYVVQDCRTLQLSQTFDVVAAAYLLNYAATREELDKFCASVARCLKPGGRFVTINSNPDIDFANGSSYLKYGLEARAPGDKRPGMPFTWTFHLDDGPVEVENYYLPAADHEAALESAGFTAVRWHFPRVSPLGEAAYPPGHWREFVEHPPVIGIECIKSCEVPKRT
ncbi:MAG: methyltransferase domain-containing protein [Isosphaeraceae bacterium]|nr:methyltransferase domain-containing protein [Isosphaeraceae bacterium]